MKIGSVFSGIGGLDLGLESSGLGRVAWQIEKDPLCLKILSRHWPKAQRIHDVKEAGRSNLLPVDLICGGFPCEDLSSLGKRAGLEGARSGLWFEFFRIICELSPIAVVVENVTSGERSWLPQVRHDLVSIGYSTEALRIGAEDVGAPHRRQRTFVLALGHTDSARKHQQEETREEERRWSENPGGGEPFGSLGRIFDGVSDRLDLPRRWPATRGEKADSWEPERTAKRMQFKESKKRLAMLGRAVVPQVAELVGRRLIQMMEAR